MSLSYEDRQAVETARTQAVTEADGHWHAQMVRVAADLMVGDRLTSDEVDALLSDLNASRFVDQRGRVDRDRLGRYLGQPSDTAAPARGPVMGGQQARSVGKRRRASADVDERLLPPRTTADESNYIKQLRGTNGSVAAIQLERAEKRAQR